MVEVTLEEQTRTLVSSGPLHNHTWWVFRDNQQETREVRTSAPITLVTDDVVRATLCPNDVSYRYFVTLYTQTVQNNKS